MQENTGIGGVWPEVCVRAKEWLTEVFNWFSDAELRMEET